MVWCAARAAQRAGDDLRLLKRVEGRERADPFSRPLRLEGVGWEAVMWALGVCVMRGGLREVATGFAGDW